MKTIVAGSRDGHLTPTDMQWLDTLGITELVSGGCRGIDADAEAWAKSRGIAIKKFDADWKRYGKSAGPIRNNEMAQYADMCVLFPGGKGTKDMRRNAIENGIPVIERIPKGHKVKLYEFSAIVSYSVVVAAVSDQDAMGAIDDWEEAWARQAEFGGVSDVGMDCVRKLFKQTEECARDEAHVVSDAAQKLLSEGSK